MKDPKWIDHLSALSSLSFNGEEKKRMAADMERIMALMDQVAQVEISEEEYPAAPRSGIELLREDLPQGSMEEEALLSNAKGSQGCYFAVPKIMD